MACMDRGRQCHDHLARSTARLCTTSAEDDKKTSSKGLAGLLSMFKICVYADRFSDTPALSALQESAKLRPVTSYLISFAAA